MRGLYACLCGTALACMIARAEAARIPPDPTSVPYQQGSTDRDAWEAWFNSLTGAKKDGANFWTEQRSLRAPIPCGAFENQPHGPDWMAGCAEAKQRLTSSDYMRRTDPQYWNGWNKQAAQLDEKLPDLIPPKLLAGPPAQPSVPQPRAKPDKEAVIAQWNGTTMTTTRPFHVDGSWELQWTTSSGFFSIKLIKVGGDEQLIANQTNASTDSTSYMPDGGDYYLRIQGDDWTVKAVNVQVPAKPDLAAIPPPAVPVIPQPAVAVAPQPVSLSSGKPYEEEAFIQIVNAAVSQFKNGRNDMESGAARPIRAQALCNLLKSRHIANWLGTVTKLSTNGEGKGVLYIEIAPNVNIQTMNNSLSDIGNGTLIDPTSSLFRAASHLHEGQQVRFSGAFVESDTDCFEEASMTLRGSITQPEFIMRFEDVSAIE